MPEGPTQQHPRFCFSIPAEKADAAARTLKKLGIDLDPRRDMIVLGHTDNMVDEANGHDAENIRACINEHLQERRISPLIPRGKLTLPQLHDLLRMAHSEFHWHNFDSVTQFVQDRPWRQTIRDYPHLFPEAEENPVPARPSGTCADCPEPATIHDTVSEQHYCRDCAGDVALDRMTDDGEFTGA